MWELMEEVRSTGIRWSLIKINCKKVKTEGERERETEGERERETEGLRDGGTGKCY